MSRSDFCEIVEFMGGANDTRWGLPAWCLASGLPSKSTGLVRGRGAQFPAPGIRPKSELSGSLLLLHATSSHTGHITGRAVSRFRRSLAS